MTETDVVLIGAGIMSATLGTLLRLVEPDWSITLLERLDGVAAESSDPWHNAGTGHSALCELNYTPELPDGSIDITRAVLVNEQFQVSRQFWSHAVENDVLADPRSFINPVPHVSFVQGAARVTPRCSGTRCTDYPTSPTAAGQSTCGTAAPAALERSRPASCSSVRGVALCT